LAEGVVGIAAAAVASGADHPATVVVGERHVAGSIGLPRCARLGLAIAVGIVGPREAARTRRAGEPPRAGPKGSWVALLRIVVPFTY
jgi:hypothetical protein